MYTLNKFTVLLVLVFFVIGCSSKKVSYDQKIEAPLSNNTLAFDLYAYKQDTSIVIATSKGTLIKIDPNTFTYANGAIVYNQIQIKVRRIYGDI
jgi:PBP1b-binding outer membrane lipoprotein LpoB